MAADLAKIAKDRKIKYFLISYVGLFGGLRRAVDLEHVAAGHQPHPQRVADRPQELVPRAEEDHRLLPAVERQVAGHRRFGHEALGLIHRLHRGHRFKDDPDEVIDFSPVFNLCPLCNLWI